jgi:hypothetical protein
MMAKTTASVWISEAKEMEAVIDLLRVFKPFEITVINSHLLRITDPDEYDTTDFHFIAELMMQELLMDVKIFVNIDQAGFHRSLLEDILVDLAPTVYHLKEIIVPIVLGNYSLQINHLKTYMKTLVGEETLRTVLSFIDSELNQSQAAKKLYMHRNTLLYRLDQFKRLTGIDPTKFSGAYAIRLLYE